MNTNQDDNRSLLDKLASIKLPGFDKKVGIVGRIFFVFFTIACLFFATLVTIDIIDRGYFELDHLGKQFIQFSFSGVIGLIILVRGKLF